MKSYDSIPDARTLSNSISQIQSLEGTIRATQFEKLSDLKGIVKQLGRDFQERTFLHQRNKQKLSTTLLRIDNEILQGQRGRETDLTRVELEGLRDEERTLQDLNTLKGQIRHYGLEYRDLQRSLRLLPGAYINRQLILDLRPILPRPMGDLILLSYDAKTQHTILLEPPSKDECKGEFQLGSVVYDSKELREFSISREDLNRHLVVVGKSGEGKTSFVRLLLQGLLGKVPFLIFSFKKEYSYLTQRPNVKVIRWDQLTFNALRPPGNLKEWVANFSDSFCQETSLLIGSKSFLIDQLGYLLKHKDGAFPNLRDVITLLSTLSFSARQREAQYLSVVQNRLRSLAFSIPHIISCRDGVNLKSLLEGNVVIELDSLNLDSQNFIISTLLTWTFLYRISKNEKGKLRHVIIFDEAKRIFDRNKEKRVTEGLPQIDILTSQIREYGVGLVVLDQEASKLTHSILANTHIKIALQLGNGIDIDTFAKAMSLRRKDFLTMLNVGEGVVKIGKLNPFLLKIPYVPIPKADLPRFTSFTQEGKQIYPIYSSDKLSILALGFLTDISLYPESRITERYKRLGMNPKTGNNLKKALLERSLIKERRVYNGRNVVLLDLTPSGALSLEQNPRKGWRKGNSEHQYWRYRAANHYRELGYEVEEEVAVGEGRSVDVIAKKGKESLGIQIETGSSDIGRNVETCLDAGCSKVFLIPTNQEAKKTVVEVVKEWYPAPVSLMTTRFLKTLRDIV